ncbi:MULTISPECIES: GIY-YIG nuclease family protein [unclassified Photobacterium]|uniref:GIY-YIG nuclease family protein n=1 Tax=unclassified Photobacterium TaxID=2628852 RepID=UPI001EDF57F6|nr:MULTISPECIES: GIY-YIG nuclease family protein [unclassified Photobacterium]MCG3866106.1 GIY-YIG nuclease family protein [Photobacterium sp. Ph6]MCG3877601.1 GIY-YIG nuclease family protein [Photobacterium sp. Ph5]
MDFKIEVEKLIGLTVNEAKNTIFSANARKLKELSFVDLLVDDNNEAMRHGVYIIFNSNSECVYVGKCSSVHFVDRLGSHLGMSKNYKYTFLSKLVSYLELPNDFSGYVSAAKEISDYKYLIINANRKGTDYIGKLEKICMLTLNPTLNNRPKKMKKITLSGEEVFDTKLYS